MTALFHNILPFLAILLVLVFVHEAGHYLAARRLGIAVKRFSVGMGPMVWSAKDKRGTQWGVSLLPLGGYVSMVEKDKAAEGAADVEGGPYQTAPRAHRAAVLLAGPLANAVLGLAIVWGAYTISPVDKTPPVVGEVVADTPAEAAGLKAGDRIVSIDGKPIDRFRQIVVAMGTNLDSPIDLVVARDGTTFSLNVVPRREVTVEKNGRRMERGVIGVRSGDPVLERVSFWEAGAMAAATARDVTLGDLKALRQIVTRDRSPDGVAGVIGMAEATGEANSSLGGLILFAALLSLNLALVNLLPIPALDGGQLLVLTVETLVRRDLPETIRAGVAYAGIAIIGTIFLLTTINDLSFLVYSW